jgi:hypothetical protein
VIALCVAEALAPHNRYRLVRKLWRDGHTDVEIARLTAMTTYTAARIRAALRLPPNRRETSA